jgi:hypothetical protein
MLRVIPSALLFALAIAWIAHGPVHQLADYHAFADRRAFLGIPNASDVLSSAAIAAAGLWGLWLTRSAAARAALGAAWPGYALFFAALALTALGSGHYHWAPDNARLVWDRLPIALACAGLIAGARAATVAPRQGPWVVAALAVLAAASVQWWAWTDARGFDDLGPYLLFQAAPPLLVPFWQASAGSPRRERLLFALAILLYAAAKAAELADRGVLDALGVSGHTIKHLLAAGAAFALVGMATRPRGPGAASSV